MNRSSIHDIVNGLLSTLATQIEVNGSLNLTHFHIHSEQFFRHLLNLLCDLELENANVLEKNAKAIDLVDSNNKIIVQVSATATPYKVKKSLVKLGKLSYKGYGFRFLSISKDPKNLRRSTYNEIPADIYFDRQEDIWGLPDLLKLLGNLPIERQHEVKRLVISELKFPADQLLPPSDLAKIIFILAKDDLDEPDGDSYFPVGIDEKMDANQLGWKGRALVQDHALYSPQVERIYYELDQAGTAKSRSVLQRVRNYYRNASSTPMNNSADLILDEVRAAVKEQVLQCYEDNTISDEQLEFAIGKVVVDAFIRCKILEKPN